MAVKVFSPYEEFINFITALPSLEEITHYTLSEVAQARVSELLSANKNRRLTDAEEAELDEYERLERAIRRAKIHAFARLEQQKRDR